MTFDRPAPGVVVAQPARGFRYGSDAMWLAGFALAVAPGARTVLDLGTGSGVVALLLAARGRRAVGVDLREEWGPLWAESLARSAPGLPVELRRGDVAEGVSGRFDLVTCNPPFFPPGSGPIAPDPFKAAARTESTASLGRFVEVALAALADGGRACFVVPREREPVLLGAGATVARWVRVGRRRSLLALGGDVAVDRPEQRAEDDEVVVGWVRSVAPGG